MSYFLSITGSPTKFSRSGFLLRSIASILEKRAINFQAVHASDLPADQQPTQKIVEQFVADAIEQIEHSSAVVIITPANKESSPVLLTRFLDLLPDNVLSGKPVLLFVTGGFPGHVAFLERELSDVFYRLGSKTFAARVHIGTGSWIVVGDDRPRLSRNAEREISNALDLVLQVVGPEELREVSVQLAR